GTALRSATLRLLGRGCRRGRRGRLARAGNGGRGGGRCGRQRDAGGATRGRSAGHWSGRRRGLCEGLIEHRLRRATLRRRNREDEREEEEQSGPPPARLGQQIARLARAEERIGGAAHAAEA